MIIKLPSGPKLRITLEFESLQFKRSSLCFSKHFECCVQGDAEKKQLEKLLAFLKCYGNRQHGPIDLNLDCLTPFRKKALNYLQKQVPFGEVLTYGELATKIGHLNAARAVGTACHFNPYPLFIPCHRIIASGKRLGGFAYDLDMKKHLLEFESLTPQLND